MVPLSNIVALMHQGINTAADKVEYATYGLPIIQSRNFTSGTLDLDDVKYLSDADSKRYGEKYIPKVGDILFSNIGTVGKSIVLETDNQFTFAWNVFLIRPNHALVDTSYLKRYLDYLNDQNFYERWFTGGTVKFLNKKTIGDFKIPLPPLAEQKRIAAILDKADAIRRKRQQAIKLADDFLRSVFLEMFGDPVTNPKGWPTAKLGELSRIRRGASPRPIADFMGGDIPWIKIGDGSTGDQIYLYSTKEGVTQAGADKSLYLKSGSLIFANCGVSLGFARILKIDGCIHDGWLAIDNLDERLNKVFLLKWINHLTQHFRAIAPDGTQPNLNTAIMKSQEVILPPVDTQREFENCLNKHNLYLDKLKRMLDKNEKLFESLSQKAFSGKL